MGEWIKVVKQSAILLGSSQLEFNISQNCLPASRDCAEGACITPQAPMLDWVKLVCICVAAPSFYNPGCAPDRDLCIALYLWKIGFFCIFTVEIIKWCFGSSFIFVSEPMKSQLVKCETYLWSVLPVIHFYLRFILPVICFGSLVAASAN